MTLDAQDLKAIEDIVSRLISANAKASVPPVSGNLPAITAKALRDYEEKWRKLCHHEG